MSMLTHLDQALTKATSESTTLKPEHRNKVGGKKIYVTQSATTQTIKPKKHENSSNSLCCGCVVTAIIVRDRIHNLPMRKKSYNRE